MSPSECRQKLENCIDVQCTDGNWNYDSYMHGLANGMILAKHIAFDIDGEVPFLDAPKEGFNNELRIKIK